MMNRLIKKILKEELHVSNTDSPKEIYIDGFVFPATEKLNESESVNDKVSLAKSLIYQLFDEVNYIKISEYHDKPLIKVYFDSDDTAANIESFFTHEICDTLKDYTGGEIVCNPGWGPEWRTNRNNPDILIDAILLKYDDDGNIINESETDVSSTQKMDFEAINFYNNKVTKSTDVITVAKSWDGGGYNWGEGSGLSIPLMWLNPKTGKEEILKDKQEKGTYCSGYVLQVGYIVAKNRNLFNNKTKDEVINLINQWYGPDKKTCVTAITNANIGKEIKFEQAQPGDFCQLWRTNGSGHNVIFLNFIKNKINDIIGIKYRSTQTKTNGIGDNIEYFKEFGGKVNKNETYFARLNNSVGGENKKPKIDYPKTKLQPLLSSKLGESVENDTTEVKRNLKVINTLLSLVSWDGLCDIWVEYNPEDGDYEIRSKTTASYFGDNDIEQELYSLEDSIRSMGIKVYTYTPWYVENCEDEPEFLNESKEESQKQVIEDILNNTILPEYEDLICGFEIKEPHERFDAKGDTPFKFISVTVTFIVGYGTKYGIPLSVRDKFDDIMNDIWDVIYNYTNIATDVYHKTVSKCEGKTINESIEENPKINLAKKLIYELFSEVSDIKMSMYDDKPLIKVFFTSNSTAANEESWFAKQICDTIMEYTSGDVIIAPWWAPNWDRTKKMADLYLNTELLKYNDEDVIMESENKKSNYVHVIKQLVEPFKDEDCVCDINVSYDEEDDMYSVYVVASTKELREKFFYVDGIQQYVLKLRVNINKTIVGYLPIENLYVSSYGKPNCEWNPTISETHKVDKDKFKITWK